MIDVQRRGSFLPGWVLVLAWMALIYIGSTDLLSSRHTGRLIAGILHWFDPNITSLTIYRVHFAVRKAGHVSEYAVLTFLLWSALRQGEGPDAPAWRWRRAVAALALAVTYAASDEFHQTFVSSREGSARDVLIDTAGAASTLTLIWLRHWLRFTG